MGFNIDLVSSALAPWAATGGTPDPFYNAGTTTYGTLVYDILGLSSGIYAGTYKAPSSVFGVIGSSPVFGADMGLGEGIVLPSVILQITTSATGGTGCNFQLRGHVDNGSTIPANNDAGWYIIEETGLIPTANLLAGTRTGMALDGIPPGKALPRWYSLSYTCTGTLTTGAISAAFQIGSESSNTIGQTQAAFIAV